MIDVDRVVPWLLVFAVFAVLLLALIAWASARRAVRPLAAALSLQRDFVADASHELRTPLAALSSRAQILERRWHRGEPIDEVITKLRRDVEAMDEVLTELLTAAASDRGSAQGFGTASAAELQAAVTAAVERLHPLAVERGVRIAVASPVNPVPVGFAVALPEVTLTRLIVALIDNAVQHSSDGGEVAVSYAVNGRMGEVRVRDQGPGIRAEDRDRIFERFARGPETGKRRGFGLGLSLVREVAQRAGGQVTIEETSPSGTTFLLTLPTQTAAFPAQQTPAHPNQRTLSDQAE